MTNGHEVKICFYDFRKLSIQKSTSKDFVGVDPGDTFALGAVLLKENGDLCDFKVKKSVMNLPLKFYHKFLSKNKPDRIKELEKEKPLNFKEKGSRFSELAEFYNSKKLQKAKFDLDVARKIEWQKSLNVFLKMIGGSYAIQAKAHSPIICYGDGDFETINSSYFSFFKRSLDRLGYEVSLYLFYLMYF